MIDTVRGVGLALLMSTMGVQAAEPPTLSSATTMEEAGLVDIRWLVPDMAQDIRYFGSHNFVGRPVEGYDAPRCWLKEQAAHALARVEASLRQQHQRLRLFDCYRPARAVADFVRWMQDESDVHTQAEFYPGLQKSQLSGVYIAPLSGHSRGATVDLTLLQCDDTDANCTPLDMGTAFDFFGARAHTETDEVTAQQRAHRYHLRDAMAAQGFVNLPEEWWHFRLEPEPSPQTYYDVPVSLPKMPVSEMAIDRLMQRYDGENPGASLLVLQHGKPVVMRGYGQSEMAKATAAGSATAYRLASVSKQFTAAAILLLAQDGKLSIDDPVQRWLPSLPAAYPIITLRHVLTHTSGLWDYEALMDANASTQIRDAGVLALLEKQPSLYFQPGTSYRYSNTGYALLALVVEQVSGLTYPDFMHTRIFQPLGMHGTLAYVQEGPAVPHRAWGYSRVDGRWQKTDQSSTSAVLGDGGIYSTIEDLARWDAALNDDRLLSDALRQQAFSAQVQVQGEEDAEYYGFGWRLTADRVWHSGETIGFRNVMLRWPKQQLTVILLTNRNEPAPLETALEIAALFQK